MNESTKILKQYYLLLKEYFVIKKNVCSCINYKSFLYSYDSFWRKNMEQYIRSVSNINYNTYKCGMLTNYENNLTKYLKGDFYFNPDKTLCKQAIFSNHIMISDYIGDQLVYMASSANNNPLFGNMEEFRLGLNAHLIFELEDWVNQGIIKLLPPAYLFQDRYNEDYLKIEQFRQFHFEIHGFEDELKKRLESLNSFEAMHLKATLFMFRESMFLQNILNIIPIFNKPMNEVSHLCNEYHNKLLQDSKIFNCFLNLKSQYIENVSFEKLLEIRKEGCLENIRIFIRDEYIKTKNMFSDNIYDYNDFLMQFNLNFEDKMRSSENEWIKIKKIIKKRTSNKSLLEPVLLLTGSILAMSISSYLDIKFLNLIPGVVGASSMKDIFHTIRNNNIAVEKIKNEALKNKPELVFFLVE